MWLSSLKLENIRAYENASLEFSKGLNVILGCNNAGKSTIIHALCNLQEQLPEFTQKDLRLFQNRGLAEITFSGTVDPHYDVGYNGFRVSLQRQGDTVQLVSMATTPNQRDSKPVRIPHTEPRNLIYPFLSNRKLHTPEENVQHAVGIDVSPSFRNLVAKIDRLVNPDHSAYRKYRDACREILDIDITTVPSASGKMASHMVDDDHNISIKCMGDGVANILGLLVNLCVAKDRVFLLEEPENDIHPKALKALLSMIADAAEHNQFIVATHSNIVLKRLGAQSNAKIFHVELNWKNEMPCASVNAVGNQVMDRRAILESLGYELSDYDLCEVLPFSWTI